MNFVKLNVLDFFRYVRSFPDAESLGQDVLKLADALVLGDKSLHPFAAELLQEAEVAQARRATAGKKGNAVRWGGAAAPGKPSKPAEDAPEEAPAEPAEPKPSKPPKPPKEKRGRYANVPLTDEELEGLRAELPDADACIEELSSYMASSGKRYQNYVATLRNWSRRRAEFSQRPKGGGGAAPQSFAEQERQRAASIARAAFPATMEKYGLNSPEGGGQ